MNKVYLSGTIADMPTFSQPEGGAAHLVFQFCVRHRTAKGMMKQELYRVSAWNNAATWGQANLRQGQRLALQGYLTQRFVSETGVISVEVAVEEFFSGMLMQDRQFVQMKNSEPASSATSEAEDAATEDAAL